MEVLIGIFIALSLVCTLVIVAACRFAARVEYEEELPCHREINVGDKRQEEDRYLPGG